MKIISRKTPTIEQNWKDDKYKIPDTVFPPSLTEKINVLKPYIEKNADIVIHSFFLEGESPLEAAAIYINEVIDTEALNLHILKPLMLNFNSQSAKKYGSQNMVDTIQKTAMTLTRITKTDILSSLVQSIFDGMTILLFDGMPEALVIDIHGGQFRSIDVPPAENTMRGSREGFIERLDVNISMLRRRLRDPNLVVEKTIIGKRARTQAAIIYIDDIADAQIVTQVKERINRIDVDSSSGYTEQFLEDSSYSVFPMVFTTERPDKVAALLLEGRVVIIADNAPLALVVPTLFVQFIQASEDYYERTLISNLIRMLRYLAFFGAITIPALYIALLSFQPEMLPYDLLISFSRARISIPFPVVVLALLMEIIIQLVIEAGLRLPSQIAQTVGIVSGIILGQAAIAAKLASPTVIVVISISIICTYALPSSALVLSIRFIRFPFMLLAATFGLFGISFGWLILITHMISLTSMGVPYFAPLAPTRFADLKDAFIRTFLWKMNQRPVSIPMQDRKRQGNTGGNSNGE